MHGVQRSICPDRSRPRVALGGSVDRQPVPGGMRRAATGPHGFAGRPGSRHAVAVRGPRRGGLFISTSRGTTSIGIEEPALFSEPGVFIVRPDDTLYYGAVQTMPFARPHFDELLAALDFALEKNYPARGEYIGAV